MKGWAALSGVAAITVVVLALVVVVAGLGVGPAGAGRLLSALGQDGSGQVETVGVTAPRSLSAKARSMPRRWSELPRIAGVGR